MAPTPKAAAVALAGRLTVLARQAMGRRGVFNLALGSGPQTPLLHAALVNTEIFWGRVNVFQVDEGVAGDGDRARHSRVLVEELSDQVGLPLGRLHVMSDPVLDPHAIGLRYAASLPERFDAVVLGLSGPGRLAGWPLAVASAGNVLDSEDAVVMVGPPHDPRLTLTPVAVNRSDHRFVLVGGAECLDALARLVAADPTLSAARLASPAVAYADRSACAEPA